MIRMTSSRLAHRLSVLSLIVLVSSCLPEQPSGIEGTGGTPNQPSSPQGGLSMTTARADHTATVLGNGKVLIAGGSGGSSGSQSLASAELYDPSSSTFTPTGNMTTPRARHSATLLADGKVLLAGGVPNTLGPFTALVSAEIYDPATGTFTATSNMISNGGFGDGSRIAILLPDGRVFIGAYGNAEIYDPNIGTFALTGPYSSSPGEVELETATELPDGRILVVGLNMTLLNIPQCTGCTVADLFDPKTDTFSPADLPQLSLPGPEPTQPWSATTLALMNGTILLVDGNDSELPDDVQVYDPASGTFSHVGYTNYGHEFATVTRLSDGRVVIAGGQVPGGNGSPDVEFYGPTSGTFASAARLTVGRHAHTATLLGDGTVLVAGGYSVWPSPTASAEIYK
jgi:hypothetical protein